MWQEAALYTSPSSPPGMYRKPSLSAHPGTSVSWGENVTLQCRSEIVLDTFHLFKEGSLAPAQSLSLQDIAVPLQANFTLSPMTSAHHGTYRCYGSHSTSPYVLSNPSDPLQLLISGKEPQPRSSGSWSVQGADDPRAALGLGGVRRSEKEGKPLSEGWQLPSPHQLHPHCWGPTLLLESSGRLEDSGLTQRGKC